MKVFEITEDYFGDVMSLARQAKEALCGIEDALSKSSMQFRGGHGGYGAMNYHNPEHMDYRDFEKRKMYEAMYPEFRSGVGRGY